MKFLIKKDQLAAYGRVDKWLIAGDGRSIEIEWHSKIFQVAGSALFTVDAMAAIKNECGPGAVEDMVYLVEAEVSRRAFARIVTKE